MAAAFVGLQFVQFPGIGIYGEQIPRLCDCPIFSPVDLGNNIEIIYLVDVRHILILIEICGTGFIKASGCFRYFTTFYGIIHYFCHGILRHKLRVHDQIVAFLHDLALSSFRNADKPED